MILTLVQDFHNYAHKNVIFVKHVHNNGDNNSCIYENSKFLLKSIIKFFDGKIFFFDSVNYLNILRAEVISWAFAVLNRHLTEIGNTSNRHCKGRKSYLN